MRGQAPNWPTVDPEVLRSWSDCVTWEDLDYFIAARVAMIRIQTGAFASLADPPMAPS